MTKERTGSADSLEQSMREWVEATLGARIVECERQARWRPAWFLSVERDGERLPLYFRGDRGMGEGGAYGIDHEYRCLALLGEAGIPVPALYGFCESPRGMLMARAPGRSDLSTAEDEAERDAVQTHYMEILAEIHALDTAPFEAAGFAMPRSARERGLSDLPVWERGYRKGKTRPEPLIEFVLRWLHQNVPEGSPETRFVCSDSGQFNFLDGRVTAVLDLELAHLGDPAEDLAGLRTRDMSEPLGDLSRATATYESIVGRSIDRRLIDYHTVRFALITPLATAALVALAPPGFDYIQYLCWYQAYCQAPIEVLAHMRGLSLTPPPLPDETKTPYSPAHAALVDALAPTGDDPGFSQFKNDTAWRTAEYLRRADLYGPALAADNRADLEALIGGAPRDWASAEQALEDWVAAAGPDADEALIALFHRRCLREEFLLRPVMRELSGRRIQMLD